VHFQTDCVPTRVTFAERERVRERESRIYTHAHTHTDGGGGGGLAPVWPTNHPFYGTGTRA
jgi:hypothetical protein